MSIQRTQLSAERTMMSVVRTSLSLIGFGFTIYQFFRQLQQEHFRGRENAPRNFGLALILLGLAILLVGMVSHRHFILGLRRAREEMISEGLIREGPPLPISYTMVIAVLLFSIGVLAIASVVLHVGPFD